MAGRTAKSVLSQCRQSFSVPKSNAHDFSQWSRSFSSTRSARATAGVPVLTPPPAANDELVELFSKIRSRIFLPSYLKNPYRKMVFKTTRREYLSNESVTVEIAGETFRLEFIDRQRDVPAWYDSLTRCIRLMSPSLEVSASDDGFKEARPYFQDNFLALMRGFHTAGLKLDRKALSAIARNVALAGMVPALIDAAKNAESTGMYFSDGDVVREALWGCRELWMRGGGAGQSLKYAEQIATLCEGTVHLENRKSFANDPRGQPEAIGALLELAAVHASASPSHEDRLERVKSYADRLLTNLDDNGSYLEANNRTQAPGATGVQYGIKSYQICQWLPVQRGLELATELLGAEMPQADKVEKHLEMVREFNSNCKQALDSEAPQQKTPRRGARWLNTPTA